MLENDKLPGIRSTSWWMSTLAQCTRVGAGIPWYLLFNAYINFVNSVIAMKLSRRNECAAHTIQHVTTI